MKSDKIKCENMLRIHDLKLVDKLQEIYQKSRYRSINMYNKLAENISKYFKNMRLKLKDLKTYHIEGFYKSEYARGLSSNSVLKYHVLIRKCLQYAFINDLVLVNVADKVKRPKVEKFKASFYDIKEVKNCLKSYKITNVNFLLC